MKCFALLLDGGALLLGKISIFPREISIFPREISIFPLRDEQGVRLKSRTDSLKSGHKQTYWHCDARACTNYNNVMSIMQGLGMLQDVVRLIIIHDLLISFSCL